MSVFRALYDFVEACPIPRMLNRKERREVLLSVGLVPLRGGELRRPWGSTITCTDASPQGFGVCRCSLEKEHVHHLGISRTAGDFIIWTLPSGSRECDLKDWAL